MQIEIRHIIIGIVFFTCFAVECPAMRDATEPKEFKGLKTTWSYKGNYCIIAPDVEMTARYAKESEDLRKIIARLLGDTRKYKTTTHITIRTSKGEMLDGGSWKVLMFHGGLSRTSVALPKNRVDEAVRFYVVYCYLLDAAASEAAVNRTKIRDDQLPLWICAAVLENLTVEDRLAHRDYMAVNLEEGKYIPFEEILNRKGRLDDEKKRSSFFHQCGSIFDYLVGLPEGRKKALAALRDIWSKDDLSISLLWHFKEDFTSVAEMEKGWLEYTRTRLDKYFDFKRLTVTETRKRLDAILAVEIITIDKKTIQESVIQTDFKGLMKHKDRKVRMNIAFKKLVDLQELKLRAPTDYQEALGEYILSVKAITSGKKKVFRKHYKNAGKLLKGIAAG